MQIKKIGAAQKAAAQSASEVWRGVAPGEAGSANLRERESERRSRPPAEHFYPPDPGDGGFGDGKEPPCSASSRCGGLPCLGMFW
jgi:hypothetical protein